MKDDGDCSVSRSCAAGNGGSSDCTASDDGGCCHTVDHDISGCGGVAKDSGDG